MRLRNPFLLLAAVLVIAGAPRPAAAVTKRALFDNFHAEQAGNADWVIDDNQPTPSPAQSAIVESTPRTYWTGAISSWGVDLVKRGFAVTTNNAAFTYGNASNPLDLSNFDVLIVPEPNTLFSASETSAILAFVHDGGGLIAISDHDGSDRNNDGFDSPMIWNAFDPGHLLGVHFGSTGDANNNITQTTTNMNPALSDSITHGPEGAAPGLAYHNGTTFTLYPGTNPTVRGEAWMTGVSQASTTSVMAASAQYGSGRVFFAGDSSPVDDGSANPGNSSIFDGWSEAADSVLFMNATQWASRRATGSGGDVTPPTVTVTSPNGGEDWKAGSTHAITWTANDNVSVTAVDLAWSSDGGATYPNSITSGLANSGSYNWQVPDSPGSNVRVRATARDAANNAGNDASNASFTISRWQITASAGSGGSVSPSGVTGIAQGGSVTFSITAAPGFAIAGVLVDGGSVGAVSTYTFSNVSANHTLAASFVDNAAPNVTLTSPNGGEDWKAGSTQAITWTATDNVGVASVDLAWSNDGGATYPNSIATGLANSGTYNWQVPDSPGSNVRVRTLARDAANNGTADASNADFTISRWQITASAGSGGSVSPSGVTGVAQGGSVAYSIAPASGFTITDVLVDGGSVGAVSAFTFSNVTANHTLAASFSDSTAPSVSLTSPLGGEQWDQGTIHAITWTATDNVAVDSVNVDWSAHGIAGPWTPVAHALANTGSYDWTVPAAATDSALVRVTVYDSAGHDASAESGGEFSIVDPTTGVSGGGGAVLALSRPTPNPAYGTTTLHFSLPATGEARLEIVDVSGRRVWARREMLAPGLHAWSFDGRDDAGRTLGAGLYLVRLATPWGTRSTRLAWVR